MGGPLNSSESALFSKISRFWIVRRSWDPPHFYALLKNEGCEQIFHDIASGVKTERVGLDEALTHLREKDVLVVWKLDRLGRSVQHLIETIKKLNERGIGFKSLQENIDTTTSGGKLIFHIFSALAEFEVSIRLTRRAARASSCLSLSSPRGSAEQPTKVAGFYFEIINPRELTRLWLQNVQYPTKFGQKLID